MNKPLVNYARLEIKNGLAKLPESSQNVFKIIYSHNDLTKNINDVIDDMPEDKLDWAMQQVEQSIRLLH